MRVGCCAWCVFCLVMVATLASGCQPDAQDTPSAPAAEGAVVELSTHLAAMAEILEQGQERPDDAIKQLRLYIDTNREALEAVAPAISAQLEALPEDERSAHAERQHAAAAAAMRRFAESQRGFRERLNEAQRIELSYVLRNL